MGFEGPRFERKPDTPQPEVSEASPALKEVLRDLIAKLQQEDEKMGPAPEDAKPALLEERRKVFRDRAQARSKNRDGEDFKKAA